jgi:hypothetical protein
MEFGESKYLREIYTKKQNSSIYDDLGYGMGDWNISARFPARGSDLLVSISGSFCDLSSLEPSE